MVVSWDRYLEGFHAERPGITEAVLRQARDNGTDPYAWLAEVVPPRGRVLDLGCGSAPLFSMLAERSWIGLDTSAAELAAARAAGARPLLRAAASAIPLRDASIDVVACSMSLMVTAPLPQVIAEITQVLRPGGLLAATIPAAGPLRPADRAAVAGLIAALGRAPAYPAGRGTARIPSLLAGHGLRVTADTRRRFGYRLRGPADASRFLSSLYLPGTPAAQCRIARGYLRFLALLSYEMPVPLRRITAERAGALAAPPRAGPDGEQHSERGRRANQGGTREVGHLAARDAQHGNHGGRRRPRRGRRDPQRPTGLVPRGEPGPERRVGERVRVAAEHGRLPRRLASWPSRASAASAAGPVHRPAASAGRQLRASVTVFAVPSDRRCPSRPRWVTASSQLSPVQVRGRQDLVQYASVPGQPAPPGPAGVAEPGLAGQVHHRDRPALRQRLQPWQGRCGVEARTGHQDDLRFPAPGRHEHDLAGLGVHGCARQREAGTRQGTGAPLPHRALAARALEHGGHCASVHGGGGSVQPSRGRTGLAGTVRG